MPRDIENMPFARSAPFQTTQTPEAPDGLTRDSTLRLESMLLEEFNYASVTAYQAQEDRARMFNLYLLLIGVLGSGLAAVYQLGGGLKAYAGELSCALLLVTGLMGIAFFTKLIRLRQAWRESVLAMSLIKEYYIREFSATKGAEGAFYWRLKTLPTGEKKTSTTAVVCATVATLGSFCFMGAAVVAGLLWLPSLLGGALPVDATACAWLIAALVLIIALTLFFWGYSHALDRTREAAQTLRAASLGGVPIKDVWDALKLSDAQCKSTLDRLRERKEDAKLLAELTALTAK